MTTDDPDLRGAGPVKTLKTLGKRAFPGAYSRYIRWQYGRFPLRERVAAILASTEPHQYYDHLFEQLQNSHEQYWPEYGYDGCSTWIRGSERAVSLLKTPELRTPGLAVFEAGCGDGMTGHALASYGHNVTLNDSEDWRDSRAKSLPFLQGNMCGRLPLESNSFDLLVSYNTFEHVEDPGAALAELIRLCKKGGHIFLTFDPLYRSPLGLHAFSLWMPYPQFLFSPSLIEAKIRELGANDLGLNLPVLQSTNKWRLSQFRQLWLTSQCTVLSLSENTESSYLEMVIDFPNAFRGQGLTVEDLTITGISILLRK